MDPLPLVGLIEIARNSRVQRQAVAVWRTRYADFPAPAAELQEPGGQVGPGRVEDWLERTGRRIDGAVVRSGRAKVASGTSRSSGWAA